MTSDIPEDNVDGMKRHEMFELSEVSYTDHLNTQMFRRDNGRNSFSFYQNLFFYKYTKAFNKEKLQNQKTCPDLLKEVPAVQSLNRVIECEKEGTLNQKLGECIDWNELFHKGIELCSLQSYYEKGHLLKSYKKDSSCGHILHSNFEETKKQTINLTILESYKEDKERERSNLSLFIDSVLYQNPVWDLGLQFDLIQTNKNNIFNVGKHKLQNFTKKCICPCSTVFSKWLSKLGVLNFNNFNTCDSAVFSDCALLLKHLYSSNDDYYYRVVLRIVQTNYSVLIDSLDLSEKQ